jgi:hypothetical protein
LAGIPGITTYSWPSRAIRAYAVPLTTTSDNSWGFGVGALDGVEDGSDEVWFGGGSVLLMPRLQGESMLLAAQVVGQHVPGGHQPHRAGLLGVMLHAVAQLLRGRV